MGEEEFVIGLVKSSLCFPHLPATFTQGGCLLNPTIRLGSDMSLQKKGFVNSSFSSLNNCLGLKAI